MKINLEEIIILGIHLGHPTCNWNPKIRPYIYSVQNGIHLIDLIKTREQLKKAQKFIVRTRRNEENILFVGTKNQASQAIIERACISQSFFVNNRWLGGILTNLATIQVSLFQLYRLEREKETGVWISLPKKKEIILRKRLQRLEYYVGGLKGIQKLPGVVVVVGQTTEITAIYECIKLNIPSICRLDTDCNPDLVKIGIPINDDSTLRIRLFLQIILSGIEKGRISLITKKNKKLFVLFLTTNNNIEYF
jgi:small subunit ribosomal protein S2